MPAISTKPVDRGDTQKQRSMRIMRPMKPTSLSAYITTIWLLGWGLFFAAAALLVWDRIEAARGNFLDTSVTGVAVALSALALLAFLVAKVAAEMKRRIDRLGGEFAEPDRAPQPRTKP